MPNYCEFNMKVKGRRPDVDKFIFYLRSNYRYMTHPQDEDHADNGNSPRFRLRFDSADGTKHLYADAQKHFYRVFEAKTMNTETNDDGTFSRYIRGDCAWSVYTCMIGGEGGSYYDDKNKVDDEYYELRKDHHTNLSELSSELKLDIEVYSIEPGVGFSEHYLFIKGEPIIEDECEYYFDEEGNEICDWDFWDPEWNI